MFKKIFIAFFFVILLLPLYKASAFLDKSAGGTYSSSVTYSNLHVVSASDFSDTIYFEATSSPNTLLNLSGTFENQSYQPLSPNSSVTTDEAGLAHTFTSYTWSQKDLTTGYLYQASFKAVDNNNLESSKPAYNVEVSYASINLSNNKNITQSGSVAIGTKVNFSCSGASEMYYGATNNWFVICFQDFTNLVLSHQARAERLALSGCDLLSRFLLT